MPAKSVKQQQMFAMMDQGKIPMSKGMTHKVAEKFASTKTKGLPMQVKAPKPIQAPENMESPLGMANEKKMGFPDYTPPGEQMARPTKKPRPNKFKRFQVQQMAGPGE